MSSVNKRKHRPIERLLLLDVFIDRRTRPIMIYAVSMIGVGAALYHWLEGWSWLDSVYFVVITVTTIGYGDFTPSLPITKILTIFFAINGVIILLLLFDAIRSVRGWDPRHEA